MGFDLTKIETKKHAEEGKYFPVRHPLTGDPLLDENDNPVEIRISAADCSRIKNAVEQRQKARREALNAPVKEGETKPDFDSWEVRENDLIDDLVLLTVGWTNNIELDGKPLEFSKENARLLYQRFPELAVQMTNLATNRVNFMPASSKK